MKRCTEQTVVLDVGTPTWHHTPSLYSVLHFASQLPFLCLATNPRTNSDNSHLTVTAFSVLIFLHTKTPLLSSLWFTHQIILQLFLRFTSQQLSLSPSPSLQSLLRDSQTNRRYPSQQLSLSLSLSLSLHHSSLRSEILKPTTATHHSKALSRSLLLCLIPLAKRPSSGPQQVELHSTSHAYQICQLTNGTAGWTAATCIKGATFLSCDSFQVHFKKRTYHE